MVESLATVVVVVVAGGSVVVMVEAEKRNKSKAIRICWVWENKFEH